MKQLNKIIKTYIHILYYIQYIMSVNKINKYVIKNELKT